MATPNSEHPSSALYSRLDRAIPTSQDWGWRDYNDRGNRYSKAFRNDQERTSFIFAVAAIVSSHHITGLDDGNFNLVFSRPTDIKPTSPSRPDTKPISQPVCASLVLSDADGNILYKLGPALGAKDHFGAFQQFRQHIETLVHAVIGNAASANSYGQDSQRGTPTPSSIISIDSESTADTATWPAANAEVAKDMLVDIDPPAYEA